MPNDTVVAPIDSIEATLNQISSDPRSRERRLELTISNGKNVSVRVLGLERNLPSGVILRDQRATSFLAIEQEYKNLCRSLRILLNDHYFFETEAILEARKRQVRTFIEEVIGGDWNTVVGIVRGSLKILLRPFTGQIIKAHFVERFKASFLSVDSYTDAQRIFDQLQEFKPRDATQAGQLLAIKLQLDKLAELERIRRAWDNGFDIEAHSSYREDFVLVFPRAVLDARSYSVSIDIRISTPTVDKPIVKKVSMSAVISAQAWALSAVAVVSSLMGLTARILLDPNIRDWRALLFQLWAPQVLLAILAALIVVNLYEILELPIMKHLSANWRGAMAIGIGCGLATNNVMQALKGFFGIH